MKINKNSWHRKILLQPHAADSLCIYFWQVVFSLVLYLIVGFILLGLFSFVLISLSFVAWLIFRFEVSDYNFDYMLGCFIVSCLFGLAALCFWLSDKFKKRKKSPNIFTSYIRAKFDRVCPKIEWVDNG